MEKSLEQFFHLNEDEYKNYVNSLDEAELRNLHATVCRKVLSAGAGILGGIGGAFFTCGTSLMSSAISCRRLDVNERRLAMIEARLKEKEWTPYKVKKRDYAIPITATCVATMIIPAADVLIQHLAPDAVAYVTATVNTTTSAAAHHGAVAATNVINNPGVFMTSTGNGVEDQINELTNGDIGQAVPMVHQPTLAAQNASAVGIAVGEALAASAERSGLEEIGSKGTEVGLYKACEWFSSHKEAVA